MSRGHHEPRVGTDRQAPDLTVVAVQGQDALEAVGVPLLHLAVLSVEVYQSIFKSELIDL